jgi:glycerol kinase
MLTVDRTGLPLSTYFSAIKLRWMIDNYPAVNSAHKNDDLAFGTIESWTVYVRDLHEDFGLSA